MTIEELVPEIFRRLDPYGTVEELPRPLVYDAIVSVIARAVTQMYAARRAWNTIKLVITPPTSPTDFWDYIILDSNAQTPIACTLKTQNTYRQVDFVQPYNFNSSRGMRYTLVVGADGTRILRFSKEVSGDLVEVWFESEALNWDALPIPSALFRQMVVVEACLILFPYVKSENKEALGQMLLAEAEGWRRAWNDYITRTPTLGPVKRRPWRRRRALKRL